MPRKRIRVSETPKEFGELDDKYWGASSPCAKCGDTVVYVSARLDAAGIRSFPILACRTCGLARMIAIHEDDYCMYKAKEDLKDA